MRGLVNLSLGLVLAFGTVAQAQAPAPVVAGPICGGTPPAQADDAFRQAPIKIVPGFGVGGFKADTANAEAQALFDHGLRLAHGFNWTEARRAFQAAQKADPNCAACWWGEAYVLGPTLNYDIDAAKQAEAAKVVAEAARRSAQSGPVIAGLIKATQARHAKPKAKDRGPANRAYADRLNDLAAAHPADDTLAALAAEAGMLADDTWYDKDTHAMSGRSERARLLLERVLARSPNQTYAIHLYIHLTEWSDDPFRAIKYADRLGELAPGASHLVHMPSHTYYRVGRYQDAAIANLKAIRVDQKYAAEVGPPGGFARMTLVTHNLHFGLGGAVMSGDEASARELSEVMAKSFPLAERKGFGAFAGASTYFVNARFDTAEEARALADPGEVSPPTRAMWRYARGEAFARAGEKAAAQAELDALTKLQAGAAKDAFGPAKPLVELSRLVLEGRVAALRGDWPAAVVAYDKAAELQAKEEALHGDPPAWWFPVRRSLGVALLKSGQAERARWELRRSLTDTPDDPLTLLAMSETLTRLGQPQQAAASLAAAKAGWSGEDLARIRLTSV